MDNWVGLAILLSLNTGRCGEDKEQLPPFDSKGYYRDKEVRMGALWVSLIILFFIGINGLLIYATGDHILLNLILYIPLAYLILTFLYCFWEFVKCSFVQFFNL